MENKRIRNMTEGSPIRHLISFALPLMVGNMFQQFYAVVDTAVVGQVEGVGALAAMGASDWTNWLMLGIIQGLTQGFSIQAAQNFGAGDHAALRKSVGVSCTLCALCAAGLLVVGQLFVEPVLRLMNTPEGGIIDGALTYLRIIFGGIPVMMAYNLLSCILRSLGDSKTPLYAMIVAALINIGLDLLFTAAFGWGIAGVAIATVIAQAFAGIYCFMVIRKITFLKLKREDFIPEKAITLNLFKLAAPIALQNAIIAVGGMTVQTMINGYGKIFIAGITATNKLGGLLEVAAISYGYAVTSYVGQNLGAGKYRRIRSGVRWAALLALATSVLISLCMIFFGKLILGLFISGETPEETAAVMEIAYFLLFIWAVCLSALYILNIYRFAFIGLGDTMFSMLSGIVEFIVRVFIALVFPLFMGREGIYCVDVGAWFSAAAVLVPAYCVRMHSLSKRKEPV